MKRIFINYRRGDTGWTAAALNDYFDGYLKPKGYEMFYDLASIEPGSNFVKRIHDGLLTSNILIALIGKEWLNITDENGNRRLDDPNDFVRVEIATALQQNVRVIPVLVDGATMPQQDDLPDDLKPLSLRNAFRISNENIRWDVRGLVEVIEGRWERFFTLQFKPFKIRISAEILKTPE